MCSELITAQLSSVKRVRWWNGITLFVHLNTLVPVTEFGQRSLTTPAHSGKHFGCRKVTGHFALRTKHKSLRLVLSKAPLNTAAIVRRTTEYVSAALLFYGTHTEC
jgi:hypothetical protein